MKELQEIKKKLDELAVKVDFETFTSLARINVFIDKEIKKLKNKKNEEIN